MPPQDAPKKCHICDKSYKYKKELNRHIKRHSDCKPYKCELCGKFYKELGCLNEHKKIHS